MCTEGWRCERCPARRIAAGPEALAQAFPALGFVVAVTANDAALLSHTGEYSPVALPGEALVCGEERIGLRLCPRAAHNAYLTPRALALYDEAGYHRAHFTPLSDQGAVKALELAPAREPEAEDELDWSRIAWRETDQITHLDALTLDRYTVLPFTGARQADPEVVPWLFDHLDETGLPFTIGVPGGGCVQLHRGRSTMIEQQETRIAVLFEAAKYMMEPYFVAQCWITQTHGAMGPTSSVELYDHSNRCVTVVTQTGPVCGHLHEEWEALIASLPEEAR